MVEVILFVEDSAHQQVIEALVRKIADAEGVTVTVGTRSARRGIGKVKEEFDRFLRDAERQRGLRVDIVVVATDANCKGLNNRRKEIERQTSIAEIVYAIPDPHVERWLMLDGAAFKAVFGKGCQAPDLKCERDRYKSMLLQQILDTGIVPSLGGIEYAGEIVSAMNLKRAANADTSFQLFLEAMTLAVNSKK